MKYKSILNSLQKIKTYIVIICLFSYAGTTSSQIVDLPLITGYNISVNAGPTICESSSASIIHAGGWFWPFYGISVDALPTNIASYHTFEAGKTSTIVVDIPAVGNLPSSNPQLTFIYGTPNSEPGALDGEIVSSTADYLSDSPAGFLRYELPILFERGIQKAYVVFHVKDILGANEQRISRITIPITVLGPTINNETVEILDTIVEPQLPYLILHAPPGDGSSSQFQSSKTTCRKLETNYAGDESHTANLAVKLGVAGTAGIFYTTEFEFSVTISAGLTIGNMTYEANAEETCITISEGFSTSSMLDDEGGGDVFVGYGTDLALGVYEYFRIDSNSCSTIIDTGLIYAPIGELRQFAKTKTGIESNIAELQDDIADSLNLDSKTINDAQNQIEVWKQVLALNLENVNNPNNEPIGISFDLDANAEQYREENIKVIETKTITYEHYTNVNLGISAKLEVAGSGFEGGYEFKGSKRLGETQNQSDEESKLIKYTLLDDDVGDIFKVQVVRDPMYGTPIFRIKPGTESSCPYQAGYQRDQPKLKHDGTTSTYILLENNPITSSATFKVDVCNESDEERDYNLKLRAQSNLNGAVVSTTGVPLNGNDLGQEFTVPALSCVEDLIVDVKMLSENSPLEYPDLELFLYSDCEESIQSSVYASVFFGDATSTEDINAAVSTLSCYPNPVSDILYLDFDLNQNEEVQILITDLVGKQISLKKLGSLSAGNHKYQLETASYLRGMYTLSLKTKKGMISKKIVVI